MTTHPMDDPTYLPTVKTLAFWKARTMVAETLDAIASAAAPAGAARARGFGMVYICDELEGENRSETDAVIDAKAEAIAIDQLQRLLPITQRMAFDEGLSARENFDKQARKAAEDMMAVVKAEGKLNG